MWGIIGRNSACALVIHLATIPLRELAQPRRRSLPEAPLDTQQRRGDTFFQLRREACSVAMVRNSSKERHWGPFRNATQLACVAYPTQLITDKGLQAKKALSRTLADVRASGGFLSIREAQS